MSIQPHQRSQVCTDQARAIVTDPDRCAANPSLAQVAWFILKTARGQTVRQAQLQGLHP